jgi:sugar lactone lactonase YvrE
MNYRKHFPTKYLFLTLAAIVFLAFLSACQSGTSERKPLTTVSTFAGLNERFGEPFGVVARDGEVYVSDGEKGVIWKIDASGAMQILTDKLDTPSHIVFDDGGNLIVADSGTHTIKRIKSSGEIETIAGVQNQSGFSDGEAKSALFNAPIGIAAFENKIFVADTYNDKIRVIENGFVSTIAGSSQGFADDAGSLAKFDTPCGIAVTKNGKILVADAGNRRIRLVEQTGKVSTLAGNGESNRKDGFSFEAQFVQPTAVTINDSGATFIADANAIRVIRNQVLPFVETISDDRRGFSDGNLRDSRFNRPGGITADETGNLYVADSENQVLRVFSSGNSGIKITGEEREKLRFTAEEFRRIGEPRWTYNPPEARRDIAGTLGEIRGEVDAENKSVWFHNGLDIAGSYGETARFIRNEKVLSAFAAEGFGGLRERLRMPTVGYIHIRLGRDKDNKIYDDRRFLFSRDENGKLNNIRIPRGAKFAAGEAVGTLNSFNHVHLIAGRTGAEMNALDALIFPNIGDSVVPVIEKVSLFDENWQEFETSNKNSRISLNGKTRIVVRAFDQMDGNNSRRKLGVYRLGYQVLRADKTPVQDANWTISFERMPDERAARFVYAPGSQSGYTPETVFNYIASNEVSGDAFRENFFDASSLSEGNYILRVFAADFFGNTASKDSNFEVIK